MDIEGADSAARVPAGSGGIESLSPPPFGTIAMLPASSSVGHVCEVEPWAEMPGHHAMRTVASTNQFVVTGFDSSLADVIRV